jgi:hypothetical protein
MAYGALPAKNATDTLTLGNYNTIKGNFEAGVPDIFTTKGDIAAATGADAAVRVAVGADGARLRANSAVAAGVDWQIVPACRVYNTADIDPATGSWVALTFNTEWYDYGAMHSTSTNTGRITIPTGGDGLYHVGGCVGIDCSGSASGEPHFGLQIRANGADVYAVQRFSLPVRGFDHYLNISCDVILSATDYLELLVYTEGNYNVLAAGAYSPAFWAHLVR